MFRPTIGTWCKGTAKYGHGEKVVIAWTCNFLATYLLITLVVLLHCLVVLSCSIVWVYCLGTLSCIVVLYHCLSNNFMTIITFFVVIITFFVTIITKIECHFCQKCQIVCQILTKMTHDF